MLVVLLEIGLVVGLNAEQCAISRDEIAFNPKYEITELVGSGVKEFNEAIGAFDIRADLVVVADLVNEGISKGYWFRADCLVEVRILDTGFD